MIIDVCSCALFAIAGQAISILQFLPGAGETMLPLTGSWSLIHKQPSRPSVHMR